MTRLRRGSGTTIVVLAGLAMFSGTAAAQEDIGLLTPGQLTVGLDLTYAPYSYLRNGEPVGFDVEALRLVAKELNVGPVFHDTRFEQVIISVRNGQFDLTPGLYMTPERAKVITLVPYFSAGSAIVVAATNEAPPTTEMELCGLKVSSIKGGAVVEKVRKQTNVACQGAGKSPVDIREYPTDPEATQALLAGGVDAQLTEAIIAAEAVSKTDGRLKITSATLLYPVQVGWGVNKQNAALADALGEARDRALKSGEYKDLLTQYGLKPYDAELAKAAVEEAN